MRNFSMKNMVWKNPGHELDDIAANITSDKKIILAGTEEEIKRFINKNKDIPVDALVLSDYIKISSELKQLCGHVNEYIIVSASTDRDSFEIAENELCNTYGYTLNKNFFQAEIFSAIWYVYKCNKVYIDRIEIFLTPCCTLKCEKCIAFIPYFKDKEPTSLQSLKEDADLLFAKADYVRKLKLLGGEGFLYPYLVEYIDYLYDNYADKIGEIRIGTNGTIKPKADVLECCRRHNVIIDISDYTNAVPNLCKLEEMTDFFADQGIAYDVKRVGEQWLDMGFPCVKNVKNDDMELHEHFYKCAMFCRDFYDGKLFFCCSNFAAVRAGLFPANENDYLDFSQEFDKRVLLEYELGYSKLGYTTFCKECNGCSEEVNQRHVPVAEQLI